MLGNRIFHTALRSLLRPHSHPRLITQLSRFPTLRGLLFWDIDTRVSRVTQFSTLTIELKSKNSTRELPPGWVFGIQLGLWQIQALIKIKTDIKGKTKTNNYVVENLSFFAAEMVEKQLKFLISPDEELLNEFWGQFWMFHVLIYSQREFYFY